MYGCVASDHKPPAALDQHPVQWAKSGDPVKFQDVIPRKWQASGFQRKQKLTPLGFFDICKENNIETDEELWALAVDLDGHSGMGCETQKD